MTILDTLLLALLLDAKYPESPRRAAFATAANKFTHIVIAPDIFQTGVTSIRWRKWFTEIGQTIAVTFVRYAAVD